MIACGWLDQIILYRSAARARGPAGITGPGGVLLLPATQGQFSPDPRTDDDRVIANVTVRL